MIINNYQRIFIFTWTIFEVLVISRLSSSQSCGPRVSARLLAEIPCDMGKSSYCSAPGSAYPWNSVKRYINDNQGLVRRMYGDEKHSSVLLSEIDGFRQKFEALRNNYDGFQSRTVYGRSIKSGPRAGKSSHRKPRPQIFADDIETVERRDPDRSETATIFRVVTETSIKVGEAITQSMTAKGTTTVSYEPAEELETTTETMEKITATTTEKVDDGTTLTTSQTATETATETISLSETSTTETTPSTVRPVATKRPEPLPSAMERIGYAEFEEEYEYEVKKKTDPSHLQNSVEEKVPYKEHIDLDMKKIDSSKFDSAEDLEEELIAEASTEEERREENKSESTEEKEEVPRRGINACPVKNEVIAPYWANNTRGETLALLNVHPFEQYVHFEKCAFENHQMLCRDGCRCEQQYRLHRLLAFDPKNECRGIFSDWFRFPSCCVCICYDVTPDIPRARRRKGRL